MIGYVAVAAALYVGLMALMLLMERHLIFFPNVPGRTSGNWSPAGLPIEDVHLRTEDGVALHAWWIPARDARVTFLMLHGNAANVANRADIYRLVHSLPASVLAVEYRGYGKSEGTPSEEGLYLDAQAAYDHLVRDRSLAPERIVAYGASLGSAVAADLASKRRVGALVLEAPFPSVAAVAARVYWFLPGLGRLARARFDTASKLPGVQAPVLIVHCENDPVLPIALGERTARARPDATFVRIAGVCHEDAALVEPLRYLAALDALLRRAGPTRPRGIIAAP